MDSANTLPQTSNQSSGRSERSHSIRAIICDFDGVLLESAHLKTRAFARLFESMAPAQVPAILAYHKAHMGMSRYVKFRYIYEHIIGQPLAPEQEQALGRRFSALVHDELLRVPLVAGAREFLEDVRRSARYEVFVASGTPEEELRDIATARGLFAYAREWHGAPKTKPEITRDILTRHHFRPDEVVWLGDATSDRIAAEETGVTFIGRAATVDSQLEHCEYRITDLSGLHAMLERLEHRSLER